MDDFIRQRVNEIISECKHEKSETLNLVKWRLSAIPEEVFECTHIKILELSADCIVNKQSVLLSEEYWWEVSFDNNTLTHIPPEIRFLKNLEELHIAQNEIYVLPDEIGELQNLKILNLRNNYIETLPASIGNLSKLQSLDVSFNQISELPPEFFKLRELREASFCSNQLKVIPPAIGQLKKLNYLDVSNFDAKRIFADTVERFELKQNTIEKLPQEIFDCEQLKTLKMENTPLEENGWDGIFG